jgi:hypothetical protein
MVIAIALTGALLSASVQALRLKRLSDEYRKKALLYASIEANDVQIVALLKKILARSSPPYRGLHGEDPLRRGEQPPAPELRDPSRGPNGEDPLRLLERAELQHAYDARMRAKYQDAARRPWMTLAPDPPDPSDLPGPP